MKLWKKILIIVLAAAILVAAAVGGGFYAFAQTVKPDIEEENLAEDVTVSENAGALLSSAPFSYWKAEAGDCAEIDFGQEVTFNTVVLEESGDHIYLFRLYSYQDGEWEMFYEQDRIAGYRMCTFEDITTSRLRIEIAEADGAVKLHGLEVYRQAKSDREMKVSQYLAITDDEIVQLRDSGDAGFSGYYDVVTDVIIISELSMDSDANVVYNKGEELFAANLQALRDIIGDRPVRIWATVKFDMQNSEGGNDLDLTKDFINEKIDAITQNIRTVVDKYGLYGIDYDWEYPNTGAQWKAYSKIIEESAKQFKVSVALPPWGIRLSRSAVQSVEHVNIMAYDLFDDRGDHANIQWGTIDSVKPLLLAGFDKSQLLVGIPTYGRSTDKSAYAWPEVRGNEETLGKFNSIIRDYPYTDEDGTQKTSDAYIQSYAEARDKMAYAEETGLGGVMIFRAKCDAPYTYEYAIHRAIKDAIDH